MIAFVSRLFRGFRTKEPAWIETMELQQRLAAGMPLVIVDVRQPEEFAAPPGDLPALSTCRSASLRNTLQT